MSNITLQITGEPDAVADFVKRLAEPAPQPAAPWWMVEKPWFGKLSAEEAADMEVGFYGMAKGRQTDTRLAKALAEAFAGYLDVHSQVQAIKRQLAEAGA